MSYDGEVSKNFHDYKIPKARSPCNCKFIMVIDSIFKMGENYQQLSLRECNKKLKTKR